MSDQIIFGDQTAANQLAHDKKIELADAIETNQIDMFIAIRELKGDPPDPHYLIDLLFEGIDLVLEIPPYDFEFWERFYSYLWDKAKEDRHLPGEYYQMKGVIEQFANLIQPHLKGGDNNSTSTGDHPTANVSDPAIASH